MYQLHVELAEVEPPVWRRHWVPDTLTMAKLDRIIHTALGWTNSHLHEFVVDAKRYCIPDDEEVHDRRRSTTGATRSAPSSALGEAISGFSHTYDFGDNWRHTVTIENRLLPDDSFNTWPHYCPAR